MIIILFIITFYLPEKAVGRATTSDPTDMAVVLIILYNYFMLDFILYNYFINDKTND